MITVLQNAQRIDIPPALLGFNLGGLRHPFESACDLPLPRRSKTRATSKNTFEFSAPSSEIFQKAFTKMCDVHARKIAKLVASKHTPDQIVTMCFGDSWGLLRYLMLDSPAGMFDARQNIGSSRSASLVKNTRSKIGAFLHQCIKQREFSQVKLIEALSSLRSAYISAGTDPSEDEDFRKDLASVLSESVNYFTFLTIAIHYKALPTGEYHKELGLSMVRNSHRVLGLSVGILDAVKLLESKKRRGREKRK